MSDWKYTDPRKNGFTKFRLTKKQHNEVFSKRPIRLGIKYEYYYNDKQIILHRFDNWMIICLNTILFPLLVVLHGFINIKDVCESMKRLYKQKKTGSFIVDHYWYPDDRYQQVMKIVNSK